MVDGDVAFGKVAMFVKKNKKINPGEGAELSSSPSVFVDFR